MSYKPYTEKIKKKKTGIYLFLFGSGFFLEINVSGSAIFHQKTTHLYDSYFSRFEYIINREE